MGCGIYIDSRSSVKPELRKVTLRSALSLKRSADIFSSPAFPEYVNTVLVWDVLGKPCVEMTLLILAVPPFVSCALPLFLLINRRFEFFSGQVFR